MPREKSSPAHPKTRLSNGSAMTFFTTRDIDQGTGLGLSVVHGIITPHGGSLHLAKR
jgi:nitrogen fixation/metabolism regulation signal transduction histidine kinase